MQANRLGCLTGTGILATLIAALIIAGTTLASGGSMYSPGALNAKTGEVLGGVSSHAEIAGNCKACHAAPWEADTMDDRCSTCHVNIAEETQDPASIHSKMLEIDPKAKCSTCHPEHKGATAMLTVLEGWRFPHDVAHYSLQGHQLTAENEPFLCADCHGDDVTQFDQLTCRECHVKMDMTFMVDHQVAFGENCLECHDGVDTFGDDFDHNKFAFKLIGKHAVLSCSQCHVMAHTIASLQTTSQDCFSCHQADDPHKGSLGPDCASCHSPEGWRPSSFDHNRSAFKLDGSHITVACEKCHVDNVFKGTPKDCFSCHKEIDPHKGQLGTTCEQCHITSDWKKAVFDHSKTAFPLIGQHLKVECKLCHKNDVYKGTPKDCASCHVDVHLGQFGKDCSQCHTSDAWKPVHFDHDATGFKLTGSHQTVECKACHINGVFKNTPKDCFSCHAAKDVHNGQFGKDCGTCHRTTKWQDVSFDHKKTSFPLTGLHVDVACKACHINGVFKGTPTNCFACHASRDVHKGQFGKECAQCHNTSGWKKVSFDHGETAFPLNGKHTTVACKACHVNGTFKSTPKACISCHAAMDIHKGQFGKECSQCHTPSGWKNVVFDHGKTAFPLIGKHATVACKSCHVNGQYKGTPKDCFSCHAKKDVHNGQFGSRCGTCHKPTKWTEVTFDHSKTAFPLIGTHTTVACKLCHLNGQYKGTPQDCFSCHAAKDAHAGQFGTKCETCHKTTKWPDAIFDHNTTAFPLVSSHKTVACTACHKNGVYKGTPKDCFACHAAKDAHYGQFGMKCETCHKPSKWPDATFDHDATSFPLVSSHKTAACAACHKNGVYKGTPKDCYSCHAAQDAHNGQFGTSCGTCHKPTKWPDATFDHSATAFPLVGKHTNLTCDSCHKNGVYRGTPKDCFSCHAKDDNHNGQLGTACATCHLPTGWGNVTFDHNTTAFPLTGKHTKVACSQCHQAGQYKGTPTNCASCHGEPAFHAGAFGTNCAQCHTTSAWTPAKFIGTHPLDSHGNSLLKHHGATCQTCHTATVKEFTCLACHDSNNP